MLSGFTEATNPGNQLAVGTTSCKSVNRRISPFSRRLRDRKFDILEAGLWRVEEGRGKRKLFVLGMNCLFIELKLFLRKLCKFFELQITKQVYNSLPYTLVIKRRIFVS